VELELFRKGQLTADDEEELEDPKAVAALSAETSTDPGEFQITFLEESMSYPLLPMAL
jgi:hypothetical protein